MPDFIPDHLARSQDRSKDRDIDRYDDGTVDSRSHRRSNHRTRHASDEKHNGSARRSIKYEQSFLARVTAEEYHYLQVSNMSYKLYVALL